MAGVLIGASAAIVFIAIVTVASELYAPLEAWLASVFFHHWIGKGVLAMIVFVVVSALSNRRETRIADIVNFTAILFWLSLLSAFAIAGFFGYEVFIK